MRERAYLQEGMHARTSTHDTGFAPFPIPHAHALPVSSGLQVASAAGCRGVPILWLGLYMVVDDRGIVATTILVEISARTAFTSWFSEQRNCYCYPSVLVALAKSTAKPIRP